MSEQSHRDEMSAAIRAQRERRAAPRSIALEPAPAPEPEVVAEPERKKRLALRRKRS